MLSGFHNDHRMACAIVSLLVTGVAVREIIAQDYSLRRYAIASGGGTTSGGDFSLFCTVAESGAGEASGGDFSLNGGFIPGTDSTPTGVTFFLSPSGDVNGDLAWQASLPVDALETDLNDLVGGVDVDLLFEGETYEANVGVGSDFIPVGIFAKTLVAAYPGGQYGTVSGTALLNQSGIGTSRPQVFFEFANAVTGFGIWVYDDFGLTPDAVRMIVETTEGEVITSPVLDSGSVSTSVEGFVGVISAEGVVKIAVEIGTWDGVDPASFVPGPDVGAAAFELDHIQIAPGIAVPCDGDANGDGAVDPLDSGFVLSRFDCPVGTGDADCDAADQNRNGAVDPLDVGYVLSRFGSCN